MALSPPAARMAAGAILLLLLLHAPTGSAQDPPAVPTNPRDAAIGFVVTCMGTLLSVPYNGAAEAQCTFQDLTKDAVIVPGQPGGTSAVNHVVELQVVNQTPANQGWQVQLSRTFLLAYGGDIVPFTARVQSTPAIKSQSFDFELLANYTGPDGQRSSQTTRFHAEVDQYDLAHIEVTQDSKIQEVGQDDIARYVLQVTNDGVYPDVYAIQAKSDPDIQVSHPGTIYVPPGETRNVTISALTPHGKVWELGRSSIVNIKVTSTRGNGAYSTVGILKVEGPYVPLYWIPLTLVAAASVYVVARRTKEDAEIRRLEKGRPRRIQPTPRQAVLLNELRRKDPDAYKAKKAAMDAVYEERRQAWLVEHKARVAADREEARKARAAYKAERKRRKQEEKLQRAQAKREAKERKILEKREAKARKKTEKVLSKKRKTLEKKKAKLDKKQAKIDAKDAKKQAKLQAKADKAAAKEAKAAAKAAKRSKQP